MYAHPKMNNMMILALFEVYIFIMFSIFYALLSKYMINPREINLSTDIFCVSYYVGSVKIIIF